MSRHAPDAAADNREACMPYAMQAADPAVGAGQGGPGERDRASLQPLETPEPPAVPQPHGGPGGGTPSTDEGLPRPPMTAAMTP